MNIDIHEECDRRVKDARDWCRVWSDREFAQQKRAAVWHFVAYCSIGFNIGLIIGHIWSLL